MNPVPPWIFVLCGIAWVAIIIAIYAVMWLAERDERDHRDPYQG